MESDILIKHLIKYKVKAGSFVALVWWMVYLMPAEEYPAQSTAV